jgi:DNA-binding MarR family transcriptional regulator
MGIFNSNNKDIEKEKNLREAFLKIKEEMTDHLEAINENTTEINSTNDYVLQLEEMINKLKERLDDAELKISALSGKKSISADDFKDIILTSKEGEIFSLLYSRSGDLIDFREISKNLGITEEDARKQVTSLTEKGIPIIKKYFDNQRFLILDSDFCNLQAKEKVVKFK